MKSSPIFDAIEWNRLERVVVLSPHIDDAALSCGALLDGLAGRVSRLVITIGCGNPGTPDPTGRGTRQRKGFAPMSRRRREDIDAMNLLGCDYVHLGFQDGIYRRSPVTGDLIYRHPRRKWSAPKIEDSAHIEEVFLTLRRLCHNMGPILIFAPMGIGSHVDHFICAMIALRLASSRVRVLFYEDFPYAVDGNVGKGADSPQEALARLGRMADRRFFVPVDVERQARLLLAYASQVPALFGSEERMRTLLEARVHGTTPSEFFWSSRPAVRVISRVEEECA